MRVLFTCGRQIEYTRNQSLYEALTSFADVTLISSDKKNYLLRHIEILLKLLVAKPSKFDAIFVGFYGQLLVPLVRLMTKKPIVFDAFISTYQTLCFDRKKFSPNSFPAKIAYWLDKNACKKADRIILDTNTHIDYFVNTYGLDKSKFQRVFVGANEKLFYPHKPVKNSKPLVFTYSEFQPLHGMEYIVEAAKLLENEADFIVVGKGQEKSKILKLIKEMKIKNVQLIDWVPYKKLPEYISKADICLGGHFGNTQKAKMVIAGKTFQFVAMEKPTIVSNNKANDELFGSYIEQIGIPHADSQELAIAIRNLINSREDRSNIAKVQNTLFKKMSSSQIIAKGMRQALTEAIS